MIDQLDYSWPGGINGERVAVALCRDGWLRPGIWTPGRDVDALDIDLYPRWAPATAMRPVMHAGA